MEDHSINSSKKKSKGRRRSSGSAEDSGWTAYFEDYYYCYQQNSHCDSTFSCGGSLISDAATAGPGSGSGGVLKWDASRKAPRKLKFKKTRASEICGDDSLEDTATSPVNSPKVRDVKSNYINPRKREDETDYCSLVKEVSSEKYSDKRV
ncbi:hypothetical protein GQ457_10G027910 [Hibiscus cannabinus]